MDEFVAGEVGQILIPVGTLAILVIALAIFSLMARQKERLIRGRLAKLEAAIRRAKAPPTDPESVQEDFEEGLDAALEVIESWDYESPDDMPVATTAQDANPLGKATSPTALRPAAEHEPTTDPVKVGEASGAGGFDGFDPSDFEVVEPRSESASFKALPTGSSVLDEVESPRQDTIVVDRPTPPAPRTETTLVVPRPGPPPKDDQEPGSPEPPPRTEKTLVFDAPPEPTEEALAAPGAAPAAEPTRNFDPLGVLAAWPGPACVRDQAGAYLWVNATAARHMGRTADEVIGREVADLHPKDVAVEILERDAEAFAGAYSRLERQTRFNWNAGSSLILDIHRWPDQQQGLVVELGVDVTDEPAPPDAQDSTTEGGSRAAPRKIEKSADRFLADLTRELRAPLDAINSMLGVLGRGSLPDNQREYLEVLAAGAQKMGRRLDDTLEVAHMESGEFELLQVRIDPARLLIDVAEKLEQELDGAGVRLEFEDHTRFQSPLVGDGFRIRKSLVGLVRVALRRGSPKKIRIRVEGTATKEQARLQFLVSGSKSLAKELAAFEEGHRGEGLPTHYDGTSLTLAIARRLARQMDGDLSIDGDGIHFEAAVGFSADDGDDQGLPEELATQLMPDFIKSLGDKISETRVALSVGDMAMIGELGHKLKGSGGSYGFPRITEAGVAMEQLAKAVDRGGLGEILADLDRIHTRLLERYSK